MNENTVIVQNLPYKYGNLPNINVMNGNELGTYDQSYT